MTEQQAIKIIKEEKSWESDDRKIDAFIMAIDALEEIKKYRAIGTVEECRAAVEKQKERKPIKYDKMALWAYACPKCGEPLIKTNYEYKYCDMCGQKLDWGDENDD